MPSRETKLAGFKSTWMCCCSESMISFASEPLFHLLQFEHTCELARSLLGPNRGYLEVRQIHKFKRQH